MEDSHKRSFVERKRHGRIKGVKRLCIGKRRIVSQDAKWNPVEMCRARGSLKKVEGSA